MEPQNPHDLIPLGAPAPGFDVVIRGYDRSQVAEAIERLEQDVRVTVGERDQAIARANELHQQVERLNGEMAAMQDRLKNSAAPSFESMGERISSMLRLAEEEAAELRRQATDDIGAQREESERLHSAAVDAERVASERSNNVEAKAKAHADELVASAQQEADALRTSAQEEVDTLRTESEAKRQRDEDDFEIALNSRRSEAQRVEAERERTSREEADRLVAEAHAAATQSRTDADTYAADTHRTTEDTATRRRAEVEDEIHRLRNVRAAVARQIFDVGSLISTIPSELAQDPVHPGVAADGDDDPAGVEQDFVDQEIVAAEAAVEVPEPRPGDLETTDTPDTTDTEQLVLDETAVEAEPEALTEADDDPDAELAAEESSDGTVETDVVPEPVSAGASGARGGERRMRPTRPRRPAPGLRRS